MQYHEITEHFSTRYAQRKLDFSKTWQCSIIAELTVAFKRKKIVSKNQILT